ncbi:alpha/beta hydrolase [Streptomyces sp. NPDC058653]|uniref:alpha/beta hydrolase n=1 Tax=Streptomyces sp. NPDC058653 TaxID=3346576 RepID=UPI003647CFF6
MTTKKTEKQTKQQTERQPRTRSRSQRSALVRRLGAPAAALITVVSGTAAGTATGAGTGSEALAARDSVPGLASYYNQPLTWTDCGQGPDDEVGAELDRNGARCTEVTVPLDYRRPTGRTITLAVSRLRASDPAHSIGTLMLNHGGPGEPTLGMPLETRAYMGGTGARYDLVGMDPRFVGRSTPLDCGWPAGIWLRAAGRDRAGFDRQVAFQKDLAERCVRRHGDLLPHVSTRNTARDMDIVRAALGERRVSYLGYSYGSYLGAVYTRMFPDRTDRVVLDSAGDPRRTGPRLLRGTEPAAERALNAWASWAAARHRVHGLGPTREAVLATVRRIVEASSDRPLSVGSHRIDEHVVPYLIYLGVGSDHEDARAVFASTVRVLERAARGIPVEPTPQLEGSLRFVLDSASSKDVSPAAAIICADRAAPGDTEVYWRDIQRSRRQHPLFGPVTNNIDPCAFWPAPPAEPPTTVSNDAPALIVSATGDTATTYRGSRAMHRLLTGSRLLTVRGAIGHGMYGEYGNACVDAEVNAYLTSGDLPAEDPTCQK